MRFLVPPRPPPFLGAPLPFLSSTTLWRRGSELGMSVGVDLPCGAGGGVPLPPAEGFALLPGDLNWGAVDLQRYRAIEPFVVCSLHFN